MRHSPGILHSTPATAAAFLFNAAPVLLLPDLHRSTNHMIPLLLKQICRHRRIHSSGHSHNYCFVLISCHVNNHAFPKPADQTTGILSVISCILEKPDSQTTVRFLIAFYAILEVPCCFRSSTPPKPPL